MNKEFSELTKSIVHSVDKLQSMSETRNGELESQKLRIADQCRALHTEIALERSKWEKEKKAFGDKCQFGSYVYLDVGGKKFTTSISTLTKYPDSMLGVMFSGRHTVRKDERGNICIDRDGTHFRHILNFLRDSERFSTANLSTQQINELKIEAEYYGLDVVMGLANSDPKWKIANVFRPVHTSDSASWMDGRGEGIEFYPPRGVNHPYY